MIPSWINNVERFATRPMTVQRYEVIGIMVNRLTSCKTICIPLGGGVSASFLEKNCMHEAYGKIVKDMSSASGWEKHLNNYKKATINMHQAADSIRHAADRPVNKWARAYREMWNALAEFGYFLVAPFAIEKMIDPRCRQLLEKEFHGSAEEMFVIISSPSRLNEFQEMRLRIIESFLEGKKDYADIADEYGWYSEYSFVEPLLDAKYFKEETVKLTKEKAEEERKKIIDETEKNKKAWEELQPRLKNKELRLLAEIIHTYTHLRSDRIDEFKKAEVKMRSFFDAVAKKLSELTMSDWNREMVVYCSISEINALLEKAIIPDSNIIRKRMNHEFIYCYENNKEYWIQDKDEVKQALKAIESLEKVNQEVKGMIAFKGKATGKVALVMSKQDLQKVKKGSILVAKTTMPDYTPAMHLAAAFVTEEGGITSHAAVIARELKKPCIVGTGNCTLVLKNGEKVEVDADNGIVRKIR